MSTSPAFASLVPDVILDAVESTGLWSDSRIYPLNSYENRVYQVGIEEGSPVIAKFYRPGRWSEAQIQEEHDTLHNLQEKGVPVVAPMQFDGKSLLQHHSLFFCVFPKLTGQHPEADNLDELYQIGELIGQVHNALPETPFINRVSALPLKQMDQAYQQIMQGSYMPNSLKARYKAQIETLRRLSEQAVQKYWPARLRPIHGDSHRSNLMLYKDQFHLLDFDDCQNGLAVQDLWLHLTQTDNPGPQLSELIEGYEVYQPFDRQELKLVDVFKTARVIQYAAWLQHRWDDPAFVKAFPWFGSEEYWLNHLNELKGCESEWGFVKQS